MENKEKKYLEAHLKTLIEFQSHIFDQGHNFWYCDAEDEERNMPFYFYQINRSKHMGTCGNCSKLMSLRKEIRGIEKLLGLTLTPFITRFKEERHIKRISVSNSSEWSPNYSYLPKN